MNLSTLAREPVRWTALNGDFSNSENWDPQEVPGVGQDAVFDRNEAYAVSFASPQQAGLLSIRLPTSWILLGDRRIR
jgi:hypothetical protein